MDLEAKIEAVLFYKAEPVSLRKLGALLAVSDAQITAAVKALREALATRGVRLLEKDDEVALATAPEFASLIETLAREELSKDLGKAGLETLSIIAYRGPISRSEIDYIRGVNSTFILRNLLIRGLIEKISNPKDQRSFLYQPTFELLSFLGVSSISELPEYRSVEKELAVSEPSNAE